MDDFWSRQANAQKFSFDFAPFGAPCEITTNDPAVLVAAQLSAGRYSCAETHSASKTLRVSIVVGGRDTPPVPADLPERLEYSGVGDWIAVSAGEWGHGFANLQSRAAFVFLSPALAAETRLVSRCFVDHYLLNLLLTEWAMLHASCVMDPSGESLIVMIAPHNTGKSTAALRLARAGYPFLADGMALLQMCGDRLAVGGYPIGEVKLRDDVMASFPEYGGEAVKVREHTKTVVDLRAVSSIHLAESLVVPAAIHLCFVEQGAETKLDSLSREAARSTLAANTVYWDTPERLAHNTAALDHLLNVADLRHLTIGSDPGKLVSVMETLK